MIKFNPNKKIIDQLVRVRRRDYEYYNAPIAITDRFGLSIQASDMHYCCPRKNLESNKLYLDFEVALLCLTSSYSLDKDSPLSNKDWKIIQPRKYFSNFYWSEYFENGIDISVAPNVAPNVLEDMVVDIQRVDKVFWIE